MPYDSVIFPGTFDPITNGHIDLIERAAKMFQTVIVGIGQNTGKNSRFDIDMRVKLASDALNHLSNVTVKAFSNLLVDFAHSLGVKCVLRGLRAVSDFEYELQLAKMNRELNTDIETLFLPARESFSFVSSSLISEIAQFGGNVSAFVPPNVVKALNEKFQKR